MQSVQRPDVPAWFQIVRDYGFRPSVPFVLGAAVLRPLGVPPPSRAVAQTELHRLLTLMITETPPGYGIHVRWCGDIGADIFEVRQPGAGLEWGPEFEAKNVDVLSARLWNKVGDEIEKGNYSKDGGWRPFKKGELRRIRSLLGLPQPGTVARKRPAGASAGLRVR